jgi:hypothetical protein
VVQQNAVPKFSCRHWLLVFLAERQVTLVAVAGCYANTVEQRAGYEG